MPSGGLRARPPPGLLVQAEARALPVAPCESPGAADLAIQTDSSHRRGRLRGPGLPVSTPGASPTQRRHGSTGAEHIPTPPAVTSLHPAHAGQLEVGDDRGTGAPRGGADSPRCTGRPEPRLHARVRRQGRGRGGRRCGAMGWAAVRARSPGRSPVWSLPFAPAWLCWLWLFQP